jgi:hypothetical protein
MAVCHLQLWTIKEKAGLRQLVNMSDQLLSAKKLHLSGLYAPKINDFKWGGNSKNGIKCVHIKCSAKISQLFFAVKF